MNRPYLRTKEKYRIDIESCYYDRLEEMFDSFGLGAYWHKKGTSKPRRTIYFEAWLTPEEITLLKISIPKISLLKLMPDK